MHLGPKASSKPVICINDGQSFESASSAARYYNVPKSAVIEICLRKPHRKSIGGFSFKYAEVA
jgi:nitric oxide synthase oxygenase domain/subunit